MPSTRPLLLALLLAGCAVEPAPNPFADRAVVRPAACPEGPRTQVTINRLGSPTLPGSVRIAWRPDDSAPWQEVGRVEGPRAWADVPGAGEVVPLGVGHPTCAQLGGAPPSAEPLLDLTPRGWECTRDVVVTDAEGAPVAGAEVWIGAEWKGRLWGRLVGWTDAAGRADRVVAPCGPVAAGAVVGAVGRWGALGAEDELHVVVEAPDARLHGRVRAGDVPIAGARVELQLGDEDDQPGGPMEEVTVWTGADGRWEAGLALPAGADGRVLVRMVVRAEGYIPEAESLPVHPGDDQAKFIELHPARRVHLRCVGAPEDSCGGERRSVRCGPAGDLSVALPVAHGPEGRQQLSVDCPEAPDLRASLDGIEAIVYDDVAWFDVR